MSDIKPCLHFIGFSDDAYLRAVRIFGLPDIIHRYYDHRAVSDIAACDTVVFGREKDWVRYQLNMPVNFSFNDSEQF